MYLKIREAAKQLGYSVQTVRRMMERREITYVQRGTGKHYSIPSEAIQEYFNKKTVKATAYGKE